MNSMTGFGRGEAEKYGHKITIELKSVNHRFLDLNVRMPRFLMFLEDALRQALKERLARGRVDVFVNYEATLSKGKSVKLDMDIAKGYISAAEQLSKELGIVNDLTASMLMRMPEVIDFKDTEQDEEELKEVMLLAANEAIDKLKEARAAEGERISKDIIYRVDILSKIREQIALREPVVVELYKERLRAKLEENLDAADIDINRFNQEILYFTDKASITEELVRLKSHFEQLRKLVESDKEAGRSLDFLVQELNREFNTIGSKASDTDITKAVLDAKAEVERIREQVQNIE